MQNFEKLAQLICQPLGTQRHALYLYGLVRWAEPKLIIEVGSFKGYSTAFLAKGVKDNGYGKVIAIDPFELLDGTFDKFIQNMMFLNVLDVIQPVKLMSDQFMWPQPVDMVFIDGDHSYEGVANDLQRAANAGAEIIAFHDITSWWGPRKLIDELIGHDQYNLHYCNWDGGLAVLTRKYDLPDVTEVQYPEKDYPSGKVSNVL